MECPLSIGGNLKLDNMPSNDMDKNMSCLYESLCYGSKATSGNEACM